MVRGLPPCIGNGIAHNRKKGPQWLGWSRRPGPRWAEGRVFGSAHARITFSTLLLGCSGCGLSRSREGDTAYRIAGRSRHTALFSALYGCRVRRGHPGRSREEQGRHPWAPCGSAPPALAAPWRLRRQAGQADKPWAESRLTRVGAAVCARAVAVPSHSVGTRRTTEARNHSWATFTLHTHAPPHTFQSARQLEIKRSTTPRYLFLSPPHQLPPPKLTQPSAYHLRTTVFFVPHEVYVLELPLQRPQLSPVSPPLAMTVANDPAVSSTLPRPDF